MEKVLAQLEKMDRAELQRFWTERIEGEVPKIRSADLLRRQITWKIQEEESGGLKRETKRQLLATAKSFAKDADHKPADKPALQTGTTLTRNWKGTIHTVKVKPDGFIYKGHHYKGLSKIAREITGTRWSGPLFFGLRKPASKSRAAS